VRERTQQRKIHPGWIKTFKTGVKNVRCANATMYIQQKMFLSLSHKKLDIINCTRLLVMECYKQTASFPIEERYGLTQQIRSAALSVHLNLAEGSSRKSILERKRFFEIARSSVVEIDTAFELAVDLKYTTREKLTQTGQLIVGSFQMISNMLSR